MKVMFQVLIALIRAISFFSLATIVDAPQFGGAFDSPNVCIGETLSLPWPQNFTCGVAPKITWTFLDPHLSSQKIILATFDVDELKFEVSPEAKLRFGDRIKHSESSGSEAKIEIANVSEKDEGTYGIRTNCSNSTEDRYDFVRVNIVDATTHIIVPDKEVICSSELEANLLYWRILSFNGSETGLCESPILIEWSKEGNTFATTEEPDGEMIPVPGTDLYGRINKVDSPPFALEIKPIFTDTGFYQIRAVYERDINITSADMFLQVTLLPVISTVEDIRQCVHTDVILPWNFTTGSVCAGPRNLSRIVWVRSPKIIVAKMEDDVFVPTANVEFFNETNAGIVIRNVDMSKSGYYEVTVHFTTGEFISSSAALKIDAPIIPSIASGDTRVVEKCEGDWFAFSWNFHYPEPNSCPNATIISRSWYLNETLILSHLGDDPPFTKKSSSPSPTPTPIQMTSTSKHHYSSTYSFDRNSDVGLGFRGVKLHQSGMFHVKVSFDTATQTKVKNVISPDLTNLTIKKASVLEDVGTGTRSLCTDEDLTLEFKVVQYECSRPVILSWYFKGKNQTALKIGSSRDGHITLTSAFEERVDITQPATLTFHRLRTNDSGIYFARLSYPGVKGSDGRISKDIVFSEALISVLIYEQGSHACSGLKYDLVEVQLTRDGEDVTLKTNQTVSVNDTVTLSFEIPKGDKELRYTQFFWKETHHKYLKQFFGKWCRQPGHCAIKWKVSKRLPGIRFLPNEYRREVELGIRINFMQEKTKTKTTSFYLRNYKDADRLAKSKLDKDRKLGKSGIANQCSLNRHVLLAISTFWVVVSCVQRR